MAKAEELVPFILYYECGLSQRDIVMNPAMPDLFAKARKTGFSNHPLDAGGATMCGLTIGAYTAYCKAKGRLEPTIKDLKNIKYADWFALYKLHYWDRAKADKIESQAIANILVDWIWASGVNGIKRTQKIVGVKADGIVGPKTLAAINGQDAAQLFNKLHNSRIDFVEKIVERKPSQAIWLKGWKRRIDAITFDKLLYQ